MVVDDEAIRRAPRLCFFAHYHPLGIVAEHVRLHLRALASAGFAVVVLSTATMSDEAQAELAAECSLLIMRDNVGLDFEGWGSAVRRFFPINAELLLFANDSVYAPVGDLTSFIANLTAVPADFYGAIESFEWGPHLQSWFLLFRPSAYRSEAFTELFASSIPADMSKLEIIKIYEVGLTGRLAAAGLTYHAAYSQARQGLLVKQDSLNAGHLLWRELIEGGELPFLKIQLLRDNPARIGNIAEWPAVVGARNAALRDAIAADLAVRGAESGVGARHKWRSTLSESNPFLWPELQGFVRRDFARSQPGLGHRVNRLVYRIAVRIARRARNLARPWELPAPPHIW
ncbi:Rhamnan synthesis protein F [Sphingomonas guangdongensis]|uniref:Rhamnan synthesis protein F n=1 Tax=Sphingomonas guangdongensis TaxID=1141890 RepID=A0A285QGQ4_9SPHN|nr:rhamnan synthesis F family protein [Sphingomonas guangdongensis]SOB81130.1 Rhamnan synthesis protein F [Sphingomonas guangdongensis]